MDSLKRRLGLSPSSGAAAAGDPFKELDEIDRALKADQNPIIGFALQQAKLASVVFLGIVMLWLLFYIPYAIRVN